MIALNVSSAAAMEALGGRLMEALKNSGGVVYLSGDLGAGKTTLVRGALRHLGIRGPVKSPTYTLIEAYELNAHTVYHIDLYRLIDPEELEYLGLRELDRPEHLIFIEWPERGAQLLPLPDISVRIASWGNGRTVEIDAKSRRGERIQIS